MILILLSQYHVYYSSGFANAYFTCAPCATPTVYPREEVVYVTNYRSTFDIVQSCLATIFACTWVAMHPDVPKDRSTWWNRNKNQTYLFFGALIAPELVTLQALGDWYRARVAMSRMPDLSLTLPQCHFLTMGGLVFQRDKDWLNRFHVESTNHVKALKKHPFDVDCEISARSKSSPVAKALVVVQVLWFVLQCIARGVQRLAITELEIMTLAYAVLNGIVYALWWHKPAGVEVPLIIDISKDRFENRLAVQDHDNITTATTTLLGPSEGKSRNGGSSRRVTGFLLELLGGDLFNMLVLAFVGSIFGGLHCTAFSFEFPSSRAFMLWKVSALFATLSPLPLVFLMYWAGFRFSGEAEDPDCFGWIAFILFISALMGYAVARIILVVVSFWALTSIPQTGHQTVMWTKFIPHL